MQKVKQFFNKLFPYDKLAHLTFVGVLPSLLLLRFFSWRMVLATVLVVAIMIEVIDYFGEGNAEVMDIVYTLAGSLIVILLLWNI